MKRSALSAVAGLACLAAPLLAQNNQLTKITAASIAMGGVPITHGLVTFTAVNQFGVPIPFLGGGSLNAPTAFPCLITAGSLAASCSVPDSALTTPANILYQVQITNTDTKTAFPAYTVPGITGTTWALDQYAPAQSQSNQSMVSTAHGVALPTSCVAPSLFTMDTTKALYTCVAGKYYIVSGAGTSTPISSVTVATGNYGSQATASFTNGVLALTIPAGAPGTPGIAGTNGTNGTPGTGGTNGANGTNGTNGVTPTFTIGTVATLNAGQPATVTITGTGPNYTLNFGVPQGAAGTNGTNGSGSSGSGSASLPLSALVLGTDSSGNAQASSYTDIENVLANDQRPAEYFITNGNGASPDLPQAGEDTVRHCPAGVGSDAVGHMCIFHYDGTYTLVGSTTTADQIAAYIAANYTGCNVTGSDWSQALRDKSCPLPAGTMPPFDKTAATQVSGTAASVTLNITTATAGEALYLAAYQYGGTQASASAVTAAGQTGTVLGSETTSNSGYPVTIYEFLNLPQGANAITVTWPTSVSYPTLSAVTYQGANLTTGHEAFAKLQGADSNYSAACPSLTTTGTNRTGLFFIDAPTVSVVPSGYKLRSSSSNQAGGWYEINMANAATVTPTFGTSYTGTYSCFTLGVLPK